MEILLLICAAAGASLLTFFSGFGLGTILLPVLLLFYPVDIAVSMTAIVHLLNGLFKTGLIGRHAVRDIVLHFGVPAMLTAFAGAFALKYLSAFPIVVQFKLAGIPLSTSPVKLIIGLLLIFFALFEILPGTTRQRNSRSWLWTGGILSGFFGGLSGHQGALRTTFLVQIGLTKEQFIATGVLIALLIDLVRIPVYFTTIELSDMRGELMPIVLTTLAAFGGALAGRALLHKVTLRFVQYLVAIAIAAIGIFLAVGMI